MFVILDYVIAILILGLTAYVVYTEIAHKVKTDLFVDVILAIMIIGISIWNVHRLGYDFKNAITYIYLVVAALGVVDVVYFSIRHAKRAQIRVEGEEVNPTDQNKD